MPFYEIIQYNITCCFLQQIQLASRALTVKLTPNNSCPWIKEWTMHCFQFLPPKAITLAVTPFSQQYNQLQLINNMNALNYNFSLPEIAFPQDPPSFLCHPHVAFPSEDQNNTPASQVFAAVFWNLCHSSRLLRRSWLTRGSANDGSLAYRNHCFRMQALKWKQSLLPDSAQTANERKWSCFNGIFRKHAAADTDISAEVKYRPIYRPNRYIGRALIISNRLCISFRCITLSASEMPSAQTF